MRHFEATGAGTFTIDFAAYKSIYLTSKAAASRAVLTDSAGKKHVIAAPIGDTNQLVAAGPAALEFQGKAPVTVVITGDADTFFRVDG